MILKPLNADIYQFPPQLHALTQGARLYDSSSSTDAKVIFVDKDGGYFIKRAKKHTLSREAMMTAFLHKKRLACAVIAYFSNGEYDWLVTEKAIGNDCTDKMYLADPTRLCDAQATLLRALHETDHTDCPITDHSSLYLMRTMENYHSGNYNSDFSSDSWGYKSAQDALDVIRANNGLLKNEVLLHGDYCLPNIIRDKWHFSAFIDLDCAGVGDRHVDIFWGAWTLEYNLKTARYYDRFLDAYGRDKIDQDTLALVRAIEVFG